MGRSLHVATSSTWRGGERQVLHLVEGLQARGHGVLLATPLDSELAARARADGVPVVALRARGDLDLAAAGRIRGLLGQDLDVLHLHTGRAHAVGLWAAWGVRPRPAVVVARRVDFPVGRNPASRLKYGAGVDRFIAVSRSVAAILRAGGVPEERIAVVHSAVDPARFRIPRDGEGLRREIAVPPSVKLIGFAGALVPHKAPLDLLEAAARLPDYVHVVLAGDGELWGALTERARRADLRGRVHLLGHRTDVPRILRSVDVYCLPSRMEGLGTSVLEAMAAGTPIVAADGGGIPEMIEDGRSGLLAPAGEVQGLAERIRRVIDDPELAARLAAGGEARAQVFSIERMVEATLAVYREVGPRAEGSVAKAKSRVP